MNLHHVREAVLDTREGRGRSPPAPPVQWDRGADRQGWTREPQHQVAQRPSAENELKPLPVEDLGQEYRRKPEPSPENMTSGNFETMRISGSGGRVRMLASSRATCLDAIRSPDQMRFEHWVGPHPPEGTEAGCALTAVDGTRRACRLVGMEA